MKKSEVLKEQIENLRFELAEAEKKCTVFLKANSGNLEKDAKALAEARAAMDLLAARLQATQLEAWEVEIAECQTDIDKLNSAMPKAHLENRDQYSDLFTERLKVEKQMEHIEGLKRDFERIMKRH